MAVYEMAVGAFFFIIRTLDLFDLSLYKLWNNSLQ